MDQFKSPQDSHNHSVDILNLLYEYDDFMDSIEVIADMGCGTGLDTEWWATRMTRDDPPEPHDYLCYAVDRDIQKLDTQIRKLPNVKAIQGNFEKQIIPKPVDLMWCHDAFQYVTAPLETLALWNKSMNVNGMLVITVPQHQSYAYNRLVTRSVNHCFYHYNACNLMYMLAVNGFDCRDSFAYKTENSPWLSMAVYKSEVEPMSPADTTWYDLADAGLLNDSVTESLNRYGHVRQEDLIFRWLDRDFYTIKD